MNRLAGGAVALSMLCLASGFVAAAPPRRASASGPELVWPLPPDPPRIRYLRSYTGEADYRKKAGFFRRLMLGPETGDELGLRKPYGVAADDAGRVYVTDTGQGAVFVFDDAKGEVRRLGEGGRAALTTPTGIAIDERGRVFVADASQGAVFVFDGDGQVLQMLGNTRGLKSPAGLAIDRTRHRLYVVDSRGHQLLVYDTEGQYVATWGSRGGGRGEFNYPTNVAVDRAGRVHVVDTGNFRVQIFAPDGQVVGGFGTAGDAMGHFHRPKGIGVDGEGHVYVADAAFNNFQVFDDAGRLLLFVGSSGRDAGQFWLPAGLFIDARDRVYVVDQANARVQVFQYLREPAADRGVPVPAAQGSVRRAEGQRP